MPKVSVYLPDDLYRQAKDHGLSVSTLAQEAIEAAVRRASTREWVDRMAATPARLMGPVDLGAVMEAVRDEFGA